MQHLRAEIAESAAFVRSRWAERPRCGIILGSGLGIPLLKMQLVTPYYVSAGLMLWGMIVVVIAARRGRDFTRDDAP